MPTLALIAHDGKKDEMAAFVLEHKDQLGAYDLVATGTTAKVVEVASGLKPRAVLSGPKGGDVQIAAEVLQGGIAGVFFFCEPMEAHPHDPDIQTLQRICLIMDTPLATNPATAQLVLRGLRS
jgi:methylglyoxal synthase